MIIELKTPHNLRLDDVKSRLINESVNLQNKYKELQNLTIDWVDNNNFDLKFKVMGVKFEGSGTILEKELISNLKLSGVAKLFSKRIQKGMETKLNEILKD
jgi:hypothetical protein